MSELRDLTIALRAFDNRLIAVEECLVILARDSQQQSEWRHQQKNRAMIDDGFHSEQEKAMLQVQKACGAINHRLAELSERLDNQASTRLSDVKGLSSRVRELELKIPEPEEVTKP